MSADLAVELLPWQTKVFQDTTRFKIVAAGRRTGKSRLAAWMLILAALDTRKGQVFYVGPTQSQARDIMWGTLHDLAKPVIRSSHINNLQITLINGAIISLKGGDRPETMRGISLKFLVLDEYADIKPHVWEQILRPALADQKGNALFIGTPLGRNHFYELFTYGMSGDDSTFKSWHFDSYSNPLLDPEEINAAKKSMSSFAFRQEFMASFEAMGSELFKEEWMQFNEKEPDVGDYYIAVDLAGFEDATSISQGKSSRLDSTAIVVAKVSEEGWWVADIIHGRWDLNKTAEKIFEAVAKYEPVSIGIEKGIAKQAVVSPLMDLQRRKQKFFRIEELSHGNKKKTDRIVWALQGRFENGHISLNKGEWNKEFLDQIFQFPSKQTHDDLIDALAYIDQLAKVPYHFDDYDFDDYEMVDPYAGY